MNVNVSYKGDYLYILHNKFYPKTTYKFGCTKDISCRKWHSCYTTAFVFPCEYKAYYKLQCGADTSLFGVEAEIKRKLKEYNRHEIEGEVHSNVGKEMYYKIKLKELKTIVEETLKETEVEYSVFYEDIFLEKPKRSIIVKSEKEDLEYEKEYDHYFEGGGCELEAISRLNKEGKKLDQDLIKIVKNTEWYYEGTKFHSKKDEMKFCAFCNKKITNIHTIWTYNKKYEVYVGGSCRKNINIIFFDKKINSIIGNISSNIYNYSSLKEYVFDVNKEEIKNVVLDVNYVFYSSIDSFDDNVIERKFSINDILSINRLQGGDIHSKIHPMVGVSCLFKKMNANKQSFLLEHEADDYIKKINVQYETFFTIDSVKFFLKTSQCNPISFDDKKKYFYIEKVKNCEISIHNYFTLNKNIKNKFDLEDLCLFVQKYLQENGCSKKDNAVKEIVEIYYEEFRDGEDRAEIFEEITNQFNENFEDNSKFKMTEEAFYAFVNARYNPNSIILGGPGRGKTTICKTICHSMPEYNPIFLAPTGKAVSRIKESCEESENPIKSGKYYTVDKFLINQKLEREHMPFNLKYLFCVDEISMLDTFKLDKLLRIFKQYKNSKFMWIGDIRQLQPVSFGAPFKNLTKENEPLLSLIELKTNFRNGSDQTLKLETKIHNVKKLGDLTRYVKIMPVNEDVLENIDIIKKYYNEGFQIISHTNEVCDLINDFLYPDDIFTEGTPIIYKKNKYDDEGKLIYSNGDRAKIASSEMEECDEGYKIWVFMMKDEKKLKYSNKKEQVIIKDIKYVKKAAAITIHCVQGSEYNNVLIYHLGEKISEELLYVACSRSRNRNVFLYGGDPDECIIFRSKSSNSFIDKNPENASNVTVKIGYNPKSEKWLKIKELLKSIKFSYDGNTQTWASKHPITEDIIKKIESYKAGKVNVISL